MTEKNTDPRRRLSVDQFRREYYEPAARPSRATVLKWATAGTSEGVVLKAVIIDGRLYIRRVDADAFFSACELTRSSAPAEITSRAARHAAAMAELRRMGVI